MNKYEKEARVYPAIAGMIIPIILTTLYVTSFIRVSGFSGLVSFLLSV